MCGIVGAVAQRDVAPILLEGLRRLEYRGYDSAGLAVIDGEGELQRLRALGKVASLTERYEREPLTGHLGIAHTRWATHGAPSELNAHPHVSGDRVAVVHNGIIENHETLRESLEAEGYRFDSDTDTEVIVHLIESRLAGAADPVAAVRQAIAELEGAYALGVIVRDAPEQLIACRRGSPLAIGIGIGEHFIASDIAALLPVTRRFVFLEDGDVAFLNREACTITDLHGRPVERREVESELTGDAVSKGRYRHFMQKEIFEQPEAVAATLEGRITEHHVLPQSLGPDAQALLGRIEGVHIVACGTSFHAGQVARYWMEALTGLPCQAEVASEFRYRPVVVQEGTLFVTISQSGETADTLAALRHAKTMGYTGTLGICNVAESSLTREADLTLLTRAGPEIGVASTKAFTTQLTALLLLAALIAKARGRAFDEAGLVGQLKHLPGYLNDVLALDEAIERLSADFVDKAHTLFLGRGPLYPVAMEGALKLKEISYIHAEAYPAGELKHGPLALVDEAMPVVAVAPRNELMEKLKANLQEVRARGGRLYVFADQDSGFRGEDGLIVLGLPDCGEWLAPIVYTLPLQMLAYHVAVLRGTDVDQPRNLAKSVTVE